MQCLMAGCFPSIITRSMIFEVARIGGIRPEGAKQISPGQSEVALRHKRRPGTEKPGSSEALKGRNNYSPFCPALSGLEDFLGTETQGVACG
jgi:hypothetical protein